ncbi:FMN reductase [Polymorphospora rubra]|uniref:FMN reductase n=1 Tax=Polymorphospora rubra TaxID=338584 RepID=A0A810MZ32_9ACTN|nr:FMN reductase [Polymorphospora rubra]BCJ65850.1 FMN reductase [Polymorphospora rubra]
MSGRTLAVVSAGLGQPSSTRLLADQLAAATERALPAGTSLDVRHVELRDQGHALVDHLLTGFPSPALGRVLDTVVRADGLIAVTPIFNASYSGLFKSFFDVLDDQALVGKPVLIGATGGTARHSLALEHAMRPMFTYLRAVVVPTAVFAAAEDWGGDSGAAPGLGTLAARVDRAAAELAVQLERQDASRVVDPFAEPTPFEQLLGGQ